MTKMLAILSSILFACGGTEKPGACYLDGESTPLPCTSSAGYLVIDGTTDDAGVSSGTMTACTDLANPCPVGDSCAYVDPHGSMYGVCR